MGCGIKGRNYYPATRNAVLFPKPRGELLARILPFRTLSGRAPPPAPYYLSAPPSPQAMLARGCRRTRVRAGAAERISNTSAKRNPAKLDGFPGERVGSRVRIGPKRKCATYASAKRGLHARGFRAGNRSFQRAPRRGLKRILSAPMSILKF